MPDRLDRRAMLRAIFMGAVGVATGRAGRARGAQAARFWNWLPVGNGFVGQGSGGNVLLWPTSFGTVLVDTKHEGLGAPLRREAESVAGAIAVVIVTHHHADHSGGIPGFVEDLPVHGQRRGVGRRIVAGRALKAAFAEGTPPEFDRWTADAPAGVAGMIRADLASFARQVQRLDVQSFAANVTFTLEDELDVGNDVIQMRHDGRGHTDNDAWVRLPEANVIHTGDLVFNGRHPFIDIDAGATTVGWQHSLAEIIAACDPGTTVVPGHGDLTDVEGVRKQWRYFEELRDFVQVQIDAGVSREGVTGLEPPGFAGLTGSRGPENLGIVFDELGG
jgi:glyoxylase-like metal-dependent hydrolase (beta-lactamase superfamily II)